MFSWIRKKLKFSKVSRQNQNEHAIIDTNEIGQLSTGIEANQKKLTRYLTMPVML